MTTTSQIRYDVEIHEPLSTPVPMPPSMSRSEALVIWMFRIAMKAPIMPASTAIQAAGLALSGEEAAWRGLDIVVPSGAQRSQSSTFECQDRALVSIVG